jgi:hypothetical protein
MGRGSRGQKMASHRRDSSSIQGDFKLAYRWTRGLSPSFLFPHAPQPCVMP